MTSVLVVDDHRDRCDLAAAILQRGGFEVVCAENGYEALRLAEQLRPGLIVLDLHLPDIDGFEVCRRLRATAATRNTPICAMTAVSTGSDDTREALAVADGIVRKPIDPLKLLATVRAILTASSRARQTA
jgi:DNA-binding response OmpR family regulator